jgi:hypothetical protein
MVGISKKSPIIMKFAQESPSKHGGFGEIRNLIPVILPKADLWEFA